jgi:hypothetical protein
MPITRAYGQASQLGNTPAASNPVINGGFDIWQRGTSFSIAASTNNSYTADRWTMACGANQAMTISRQATSDTTNLPNIQYCLRFQRNSGQTGTGAVYIAQSFETVNSIYFAGKTITLSFYARAGANYSASSSTFSANIATGTGTDQNRITGPYTGDSVSTTNVTLTTTWQRFSYTITAATNITELAIFFNYTPTGTAGAADYFEVTGVQIDMGSVALPFRRAMNTLAGELAACQRYYYSIAGLNVNLANATGYSTTVIRAVRPHPVPMRGTPSFSASSGTSYYRYFGNNTSIGVSSITDDYKDSLSIQYNITTTGLTVGYSYWIVLDNASSKIEISAEL